MILASVSLLNTALSLCAILAYAAPAIAGDRWPALQVCRSLAVAWVLHVLVLVASLIASQPRFGFAPALSFTAWLVLSVYAIESRLFPQLKTHGPLYALGAVAIVLAWVFPGSTLHPGASGWLPLHWALGLASYGMFAAAVVHGWLLNRTEQQIRQAADPHGGLPLLTLEKLTFRFVQAGFALLTATLLAGALFGEQLYGTTGHGWRWDHKTVFSVLAWLCFSVLLLGRYRLGWRGRKAVRMLYIGSGLLLLAYAGSRFVLEVVLGRVT
jgi:ABC-type uncharacterized transport system permease subunit